LHSVLPCSFSPAFRWSMSALTIMWMLSHNRAFRNRLPPLKYELIFCNTVNYMGHYPSYPATSPLRSLPESPCLSCVTSSTCPLRSSRSPTR
jgi:hypothetical protein